MYNFQAKHAGRMPMSPGSEIIAAPRGTHLFHENESMATQITLTRWKDNKMIPIEFYCRYPIVIGDGQLEPKLLYLFLDLLFILKKQAFHFGKTDFELGVGGEGQVTTQHFEGSSGPIRAILPKKPGYFWILGSKFLRPKSKIGLD